MATVQPFTREMIKHYLQSREMKYLTDSDGDFQLGFEVSEITGCRLTIYLWVQGKDLNIYAIKVRTSRDIPEADWGRVTYVCNRWNAEHRWPKAFLDVREVEGAGSGDIVLEQHLDLGPGIHQELFDDLTNTILAAAVSFWVWAHKEHGL